MAWKANVTKFIAEFGRKRMNGKVASDRTVDMDQAVLMKTFLRLHAIGLKIEDPKNLKPYHFEALVKDWYKAGLKPKTMQNDLSRLRTLMAKAGKKNMVLSVKAYLPEIDPKLLVVSTVAQESKSASEKGINVYGLLQLADDVDMRFGLMLRLQLAFGLRVKEVLHTNPSAATIDDNAYRLYEGETKGNRVRFIRVLSKDQEQVLAYVSSKLKKNEFLRWPETPQGKKSDYKWARERYYELAKRIGLTLSRSGAVPHGFRAQFAENSALITGFVPKTLGGNISQMNKEDRILLEGGVKEDLGHSFHRRDITGAYYGSFGRGGAPIDADYIKRSVEAGIAEIEAAGEVEEPDMKRLDDCLMMIGLLSKAGVQITVPQVYTLWRRHSRYRIGCEWSVPEAGVVERSLAVEGTRHLRVPKGGDENRPNA